MENRMKGGIPKCPYTPPPSPRGKSTPSVYNVDSLVHINVCLKPARHPNMNVSVLFFPTLIGFLEITLYQMLCVELRTKLLNIHVVLLQVRIRFFPKQDDWGKRKKLMPSLYL